MKCSLRVIGVVLLLAVAVGRAEGPDEQYVRIYSLIQEADGLNDSGQARQAMAKYAEAQAALARFPTAFPGWNDKVVSFRLNYVNTKLGPLLAQYGTNAVTAPAEAEVAKTTTGGTNALLRDLQEELRRLQADNTTLAAKLKEALSVQPSASDPRELAKAEERSKALQKENELLKTTLSQEQLKSAQAIDPELLAKANRNLAETKATVEEQTRILDALRSENEILKKQAAASSNKDTASGQQLSQQLQQARDTLASLQAQNDTLRAEKTTMEARVAELAKLTPQADSKKVKQLREELDKQAAAAKAAAKESETQARSLEKENAALKKDKTELEAKLVSSASDATKAEIKKRKQLESDLEDVRAKLQKAEKQLAKRSTSKGGAAELQQELAALQARVQVLEAKPSPYTAEELAALRKPDIQLIATSSDGKSASPAATAATETKAGVKKTVKELPPGAGGLAAAAQRAFLSKRYDEAEQKYLDILRQDEKNVFTLGNVAAIQIEMNKLDEAEKNLKTALSVDPQDDFSLYLMGRVKFLRGKMDEALDLLSQSAKANPDSAETQNYLGIVLSEKGLRPQAEAAFRKAIQLQPNYAAAHNNLAFIYATQKPPSLALARWHYQKAQAAGHPPNPDLEKLLNK